MHWLTSALEPAARITVATLFNSLWEAALLAFAVWGILRVLPNLNATTRYAAWCVALVGSLLLPLATAIPQITVQHTARGEWTNGRSVATPSKVSSHSTVVGKVSITPAKTLPQSSTPAFRLPERLRFSLPEYVALGLFCAWVLATLLLLVRLGVNLWRLESLKRDALPLPLDYRERLSQWAAAEKGEREVRLCVCDRIEVPVAVGLFDSMILLPKHLLDSLSPDEIDQIMLHELGHLRRADDWTNGLQRLVQALFFFNPAILYIAQQLDLEREVACDDWVVDQTKSVRPYATCLTKMAEVTSWPHRPLAAPGVFVTRRGLSVRVERLLRAGRNVRTSISFGPAGAVVAALVVLFFLLQTVAPSFAFTGAEPSIHQPKNVASAQQTTHWRTIVPTRVAQKHSTSLIAAAKPTARPTATPSSSPREIVVPAVHVHVPATTIPAQHIPAINVDVPERHLPMPMPPMSNIEHAYAHAYAHSYARNAAQVYVHPPLPTDFAAKIARSVNTVLSTHLATSTAKIVVTNGVLSCTGCDYSGQNLSGRSFRGQNLNGSDFSRANLQNADFSNAKITGVDFSHANLQGANFSHATMNGCDLSHANLAGVRFDGTEMVGCDVDARSLAPSQARQLIYACRNGCDFAGANLSGQNLRGLSLTGVDLSGADLRNVDFSGGSFNGVDFSGAKLDGARFTGASITGCDLSGVDLNRVDLSNAKLTGDRLTPK